MEIEDKDVKQLSELHQHVAVIEKEIAETELRLASLKRHLAANRTTIDAVKTFLQTGNVRNASLRCGLDAVPNLHPKMK